MGPTTLRCPGCSAALTVQLPLPLDKTARCPRCGAALDLPKAQSNPATAAIATAPMAHVVQTAPGMETAPAAIPLGIPQADAIQPVQALPLPSVPQAFPEIKTASVRSVGRTISPRVWIGIGVGVAALLFFGMLTVGLLAAVWWKARTVSKEEQVASRSAKLAVQPMQRPAVELIPAEPPFPVAAPNPQPLRTVISIDKVGSKQAWLIKTMVDAYDKVGVKNPRWDEAVRRVIRQTAENWDYPLRNMDDLYLSQGVALNAGCKDPMYDFTFARLADDRFGHDRMADEMQKSAYHPVYHCFTAIQAVRWFDNTQSNAERKRQKDRYLKVAEKLLPVIAKDPSVPPEILVELCEKMEEHYRFELIDRKEAFDKVMELFAKAGPEGSGLLTFRGKFYILYAWLARGNGDAKSVTPNGRRLFAERQALAEKALEKTWRLDPNNAAAATHMLNLGEDNNRPREKFELWFRRAMQADPDNYLACDRKIFYLGNQPNEMLAFGRECLETQNWRGRLPHILLVVHESLARDGGIGEEAYYHQPKVWADVQAVLEPFTKKYPRELYWRSRYAYLACRCGHWVEAHRLLARLGKEVRPDAFGGPERLEDFRQEACAASRRQGRATAGTKG